MCTKRMLALAISIHVKSKSMMVAHKGGDINGSMKMYHATSGPFLGYSTQESSMKQLQQLVNAYQLTFTQSQQ